METSRLPGSLGNGLSLITRCPLCDAAFDPLEAQVLGEGERGHLLHIRCRSCEQAVLAIVTVSKKGIFSMGLLTDLTSEDALRFHHASPVTADDVLRTHALLADETGVWDILRK